MNYLTSRKLIQCFFITLFLFGCRKDNNCNPYFLNNKHQGDIPVIQFEKNETRESILYKFRKEFGDDLCGDGFVFGFPIEDEIALLKFRLKCFEGMVGNPKSSLINIVINESNEMLINSNYIIKSDSFFDWLSNMYTFEHLSNEYRHDIIFKWNIYTPLENFKHAILEVIKAVFKLYNSHAIILYGSPICDLSAIELEAFYKSNEIELIFEIGYDPPQPHFKKDSLYYY